jgi:hypothetical protein
MRLLYTAFSFYCLSSNEVPSFTLFRLGLFTFSSLGSSIIFSTSTTFDALSAASFTPLAVLALRVFIDKLIMIDYYDYPLAQLIVLSVQFHE